MRRGLLAVVMIWALSLSLSCGQTEEETAARIGEYVITEAMMRDEYLAITKDARPDIITIEQKEQFARDVVSKEILEMEARMAGIDKMPESVQASNSAIRSAAWQAFYNDKVKSQVKVTEEQLKDIYASQKYTYHIGWIFLRSKALADEIAKRIEAGEDFTKLASRHSIDVSRDRGGDIGVRALGTLPADVEVMLMAMSPGEVSDAILYDNYYILVKLFDKRTQDQQGFENARSGLESIATMRAENERQRALAGELRDKYRVSMNDDVVDLIVSKTTALYPSEAVAAGEIPEFSDEELDRVVATYDGGAWPVRKYVEALKSQPAYFRPGYLTSREEIKTVLRDLITGELWMVEIGNEGYDRRPEVLKAGAREMEKYMVTEMHNRLVADVEVTDEEIETFYEERKAEFVTEPGAKLAIIVVSTEEEGQQVYSDLQAGRRFADLARERSIDEASAKEGGELVRPLYQRTLEMFPEVEDAVDTLDVGEYSKPFPVPPGFGPGGYMVMMMLEKIQARQMEFEEVKDLLAQRVLQIEQDKVFGEWLRDKMAEYDVEIFPHVLERIKFPQLKEQEA